MTYENINIQFSNFCRGPQAGTICTIDTTNAQTVLKVKNTSGATIIDLTLSSNILSDNVRLEYVGPTNLTALVDDLIFFTFEKVSDSICMIKRWQTRLSYSELLLKEQIIKNTSGDVRYNAIDFAVEYYQRSFANNNEYYDYVVMDDVDGVQAGTKLFLGPSTDADNTGATELVEVTEIVEHISETRVYLTGNVSYQYRTDDPINFYTDVYVLSSEGYGGDLNQGCLLRLDAYDWSLKEADNKIYYKRFTSTKWCPYVGAVAGIVNTNMFFIKPETGYSVWRSMFLNNVMSDENTTFTVYDVIFIDYSFYKLQDRISLRSGTGSRTVESWSNYNYVEATLLPYADSLIVWQEQSIVTGYSKIIDINSQVRDQFHVGLRDIYITFSMSGDSNAAFDPLNGIVITDSNGEASLTYTSGYDYTGITNITAQAEGSSSTTGSEYVWSENNVTSIVELTDQTTGIPHKDTEIESELATTQIRTEFKIIPPNESEVEYPGVDLLLKSFFTYPGGDWGSDEYVSGGTWEGPDAVELWLPALYLGKDKQVDSPRAGEGYGFTDEVGEYSFDILRQVVDFDTNIDIKSLTNFLVYIDSSGVDNGNLPYVIITQPDETNELQISQLKLSLHTYWAGDVAYDYLWTFIDLDQFVFVEDAVPSFWSEKNPKDTDIWIRLRPFAFSLDMSTLKFYVREVSYIGDTGYVDYTNYTSLTTFDAGSGLLGIEATCDPPVDFLHGSRIFVRIEVYDQATYPNFIYVEYWFDVVPDYVVPYLTNLNPSREDENIPVDTTVYFEIKDEGSGVDIDSLECYINSRLMLPQDLNIETVSRFHYKITYTPPEDLYFDKSYKINVKVNDISENENRMNDSYRFYTVQSPGVNITDPNPGPCKRGMNRFEDVSVVVLADGAGIDVGTIRMQVFNKDTQPQVLPVVYRIS